MSKFLLKEYCISEFSILLNFLNNFKPIVEKNSLDALHAKMG